MKIRLTKTTKIKNIIGCCLMASAAVIMVIYTPTLTVALGICGVTALFIAGLMLVLTA